MHPPSNHPLFISAAATLLELVACACNASESGAEALTTDDNMQTLTHCESCMVRAPDFTSPTLDTSTASLSANRVARPAPDAKAVPAESATSAMANPFADLRFRDQEPLVNRLRRLQAVPFVTLWDSREATVYVGLNRKGKAGLHLRQKTDDRGARAARTLAAPEDERAPPRPPKSRHR